MNTYYKLNIIAKWHLQIFSALCLSAVLLITAIFAQAGALRANGKIAFVSTRDNGNPEIYVMNSDGSQQTRLTITADAESSPSWSPDGKKLAFLSRNNTGNYVLKLMNADGSNQTFLTAVIVNPVPYGGSMLSWSPDGRKIAFPSAGEIFTINVDGSNLVNLTNDPARDTQPSWSPDGTRITFNRYIYVPDRGSQGFNPFVHIMNSDGSNVQRFAPDSNFLDSINAKWSPDGHRLLFLTINSDLSYDLMSLNIDGTSPQYLEGCSDSHDWSPDGNKIVFHHCNSNGYYAIYTMNAAGGGITQIGMENDGSQPDWQPQLTPTFADFDGDTRTDISIFRPSNGQWWYYRSSDGGNAAFTFGTSSDKLVPADYTGDGKADVAIFRPSTGEWFILRSEDSSYYSFPFGISGDIPAPGDFDGDSKADVAVFRPTDSTWYINLSSGATVIQQFGSNGDAPVVADYDGDGKSDIAIYRPSLGQWWIQRTTAGTIAYTFGNSTDKPVQGDYTGDGKEDVAVWRPSTGEWFVLRSENQSYYSFPFGLSTDIPTPGDFDGDGKFDATVFRPSNSTWYSNRTTAGTLIQSFGQNGDVPVPNAFVP